MVFDALCRYAERHDRELLPLVRQAKLFWFDAIPQHVLNTKIEPAGARMHNESFFLPFGVIAIEDRGGCVILADVEAKQKGLPGLRVFVEAISVDVMCGPQSKEIFLGNQENVEHLRQQGWPPGAILVTAGKIGVELAEDGSGNRWLSGSVRYVRGATKDLAGAPRPFDKVDDETLERALQGAETALREVMYFNSPSRFVVERIPLSCIGKPDTSAKIPRSHERPMFTLIDPRSARRVMGLPEPTGEGHASPSPHERRRHYRTMRSERFTRARGRTIIIPACWVGPSESVVGKHMWKVRLDI